MEINNQHFEVNGITLHAATAGPEHGKVMLFLHGFPEFSLGWKAQLTFFAEQGYRVVAPDQRGYHLSSKPKGVKAYCFENLVADMVALIKQISTQKIILAGHDWGGAIAWELAGQHPELVEKLLILNMPHLKVMGDTLKSNPKQLLRSWYFGFFQLPRLPEWLLSRYNFRLLAKSMVKTANKNTFSKTDLDQYKTAWQNAATMGTMINWYRAYKYSQLALKRVTVPTLILWGNRDTFLLPEMAEKSNLMCAKGKLIVLDDVSHWLHHEKPARINQLMLNFIR